MHSAASLTPVPRGRPSTRFKLKEEAQRRCYQDMLQRVSPVVIAVPASRANLKAIAEEAKASPWVLRRHFGTFEDLLRAVWDRQVKLVVTRLACDPAPTRGVQASIHSYASFVAGVMQSDAYHGILLLLVRYGSDCPWMPATYERVICQTVRRGLENVIHQSGEESGCAVVVNEFASAEFHKKIETELATCRIIPPYLRRQPVEVSSVVAKIAADTFRATHALDWMDSRVA